MNGQEHFRCHQLSSSLFLTNICEKRRKTLHTDEVIPDRARSKKRIKAIHIIASFLDISIISHENAASIPCHDEKRLREI